MIAPTRIYDNVPTITPEEAADMVKHAVIYRPQRIATRLGVFAQMLHAVAPKVAERQTHTWEFQASGLIGSGVGPQGPRVTVYRRDEAQTVTFSGGPQ